MVRRYSSEADGPAKQGPFSYTDKRIQKKARKGIVLQYFIKHSNVMEISDACSILDVSKSTCRKYLDELAEGEKLRYEDGKWYDNGVSEEDLPKEFDEIPERVDFEITCASDSFEDLEGELSIEELKRLEKHDAVILFSFETDIKFSVNLPSELSSDEMREKPNMYSLFLEEKCDRVVRINTDKYALKLLRNKLGAN